MVSKTIISIKNLDKVNKNSVLLYDSEEKVFYATTKETLFDEYRRIMNKALDDYERKIIAQDERIQNLEKSYGELIESIKESNSKVINLVEKAVKEK